MFTDLKDYGFTQAEFLACENLRPFGDMEKSIPGRIVEGRRERFKVMCLYGIVPAEIKGSFYHSLEEGGK